MMSYYFKSQLGRVPEAGDIIVSDPYNDNITERKRVTAVLQ